MTQAQMAAVLMLLQAFGVGPNVIATTQYELTSHTQVTSTTQATTTQALGGSPAVATTAPSFSGVSQATSTVVTVPPPTCTFSATLNKEGHAVFSWTYPNNATGRISGAGLSMTFFGDVPGYQFGNSGVSKPLPISQADTGDAFMDKSVITQPKTYTLTVTNAGGTGTCTATVNPV